MLDLINTLPKEITYLILDYHPFFYKYPIDYVKTILINDLYHKDELISKQNYIELSNKYSFCYSDVYLYNSHIIHTLMLPFESNIFDSHDIMCIEDSI